MSDIERFDCNANEGEHIIVEGTSVYSTLLITMGSGGRDVGAVSLTGEDVRRLHWMLGQWLTFRGM